MRLSILRDLFRPRARRAAPEYSIDDPRHPANAGWYRTDMPEGRPIRFRIDTGFAIPRVAPPAVPLTAAQFIAGGGGHAESHVEPRRPTSAPAPARVRLPLAPRADTA